MKVALVQLDSRHDKARNIQRALVLCEKALFEGATFVLLPEYFYFRGPLRSWEELAAIVEPVNGPTAQRFSVLAKKFRAHILLGSIYERVLASKKAYNTAVLIDPSGKVSATYRKQHLFHMRLSGYEICEGRFLKPGRELTVVPVGEFRLGIAVCFDVRFPDIFERSAQKGANLFAIPASFSYTTGKAHWEMLVRTRAVETFSYVLAPNQTGVGAEGVRCWGHSMIVDPWGRILAEASANEEEIVCADIDFEETRKYRERFPGYKKIKSANSSYIKDKKI